MSNLRKFGNALVDLDRVVSLVKNCVTFVDGQKVFIPLDAADELRDELERKAAGHKRLETTEEKA